MNKEEFVREIYYLLDGSEDWEKMAGDRVDKVVYLEAAEYLLSKYHLIDKKTKCYEGELRYDEFCGGNVWVGYERVNQIIGMRVRLFIEEEK